MALAKESVKYDRKLADPLDLRDLLLYHGIKLGLMASVFLEQVRFYYCVFCGSTIVFKGKVGCTKLFMFDLLPLDFFEGGHMKY